MIDCAKIEQLPPDRAALFDNMLALDIYGPGYRHEHKCGNAWCFEPSHLSVAKNACSKFARQPCALLDLTTHSIKRK